MASLRDTEDDRKAPATYHTYVSDKRQSIDQLFNATKATLLGANRPHQSRKSFITSERRGNATHLQHAYQRHANIR